MATYYVDGAVGSDSNAGTSPGAGGAWATLSKAATVVAAGDTVNVKASATYYEALTLTASGSNVSPISWVGYTSTPGDGGRFTIDGGNTRTTCVDVQSTSLNLFLNAVMRSATAQLVAFNDTSSIYLANCRLLKGSATSVSSFEPNSGHFGPLSIYAFGCEVGGVSGVGIGNANYAMPILVDSCAIHGTGADGVGVSAFRTIGTIRRNRMYNLGGTGVIIRSNDSTSSAIVIADNSIYGTASDAIQIDGGSDGVVLVQNNVLDSIGRYHVNILNAPSSTSILTAKNFLGIATSGQINDTTRRISIVGDVTLSATPFNGGSTGDLSLNNSANGGALVRANAAFSLGADGVQGFADGGALQHQDSGGGGSGAPFIGIIGGW